MSDTSTEVVKVDPAQEEVFEEFAPSLPLRVKQRGPQGGIIVYMVNEVSGNQEYWEWNRRMEKMTIALNKGALPDENYYNLVTDMLVLCLTLNGNPVDRVVPEKWGLKLKEKAFELARTVNGMDKKGADQVGNSLSGAVPATTGSVSPNESVAP